MSKLIVEMEMPTRCCDCDLADGAVCMAKGGVYGREVPKMTWIRTRPDWCPICGVLPDEHGDLIDRDALKKQCWNDDGFDLWVSHTEIDQQPTVIAAERKDDETDR